MSKVLVMTGGPRVGKTTIVKAIMQVLAAKGVGLSYCAPTGRAAKRLTEATGSTPRPSTAAGGHPKGGGFKRGDQNPSTNDLMAVDGDLDGPCPDATQALF